MSAQAPFLLCFFAGMKTYSASKIGSLSYGLLQLRIRYSQGVALLFFFVKSIISAISTKKHFKDMLEVDDETCKALFTLAKKVMITLKEVYSAESVYLCTMCDGPMNHFHIQLIPRYSFEKRGSNNFVKPRFEYKEDKEKIEALRSRIDV